MEHGPPPPAALQHTVAPSPRRARGPPPAPPSGKLKKLRKQLAPPRSVLRTGPNPAPTTRGETRPYHTHHEGSHSQVLTPSGVKEV